MICTGKRTFNFNPLKSHNYLFETSEFIVMKDLQALKIIQNVQKKMNIFA